MKADFVATVSHELRTPLAAIYGSAQTIRRTDIELDPEIQDQLLGVIASESDRLGTIVNDLLVAGRLDADQLPVTVEQLRSGGARGDRHRGRADASARGRRARARGAGRGSRASSPTPASCTRCSSTSSTTRSSTRPRAARSLLSVANGDGADPVRGRRHRASASPPPSTGGSSRSSTASIPT